MSNQELRFTGFKDPSGLDIYEGDYIILKLSDLTDEQREARTLNKMIELFDIQYMQAYIKPTGELRYEIDLIFIDSQNKALTVVEYSFAEDNEGMTFDDYLDSYPKDLQPHRVYNVPTHKHFQLFKGIISDNLWIKQSPLVNREHING
jgi:hypothetical protein